MSKTKTILITGSTDGVGKELALSLATAKYELILHGRNADKGRNLLEEIRKLNPDCEVSYMNADFASISDINTMANEILERFSQIDILVNNAGVIEKKRKLTEDGFERTFMINHLSMFLLTLRILPLLNNEEPSRIINVSSQMHNSTLDFDNLQGEKDFSPSGMYGTTKLLNILFTYKLADLLKESKITVNCLHPGVFSTNLFRTLWGGGSGSAYSNTLGYMVSSPEIESTTGKYYRDSQESSSSKISHDKGVQDKIWSLSEDLANIKFAL